jgi:hypothetical protein
MPRKSGKITSPPTGEPKRPKRPSNWDIFFGELAKCGNTTKACESINVSRIAVYDRLKYDTEFKARYDAAKALGADGLEDEATRRAHDGVEEAVFFQGVEVATVTKFSDGLIQFLLKANKPEKFKDRSSVEVRGTTRPLEEMSIEDLEQLLNRKKR